MASQCYNSGLTKLTNGSIDWDTDTIKIALVTSSYTPDVDAHDFYDDISANEVAASGSYSAGGVTLTCQATQDNTNNRTICDASDWSVTTFTGTFRYGIVYKSTGTPGTSPLICYVDFTGSNISVVAGTFSVTVNAAGVFNLTSA